MISAYSKEGRAIVKLDANVESIVQQKEKFLVSITYRNSGAFPMKMFTPDRWAEYGDRLEVGGVSVDGKDKWEASVAGLPLVNQADFSEFSDGIVTLPAGGSVTFKFLTVPSGKIKRGTYLFNVLTFASIGGDGVVATIGKVVFRSDPSNPTRVTFDRDYPSTPQEWNEYEALHRAKMSSFPTVPGEAFPEDGYYRLVSNGGQRSRFVFHYRRDAIAPQGDEVQAEDGTVIYGRARWQWEADSALHDFCGVGEPCPREGRWISGESGVLGKKTNNVNPHDLRRFVAGQLMPSFSAGGRHSDRWYWLGV